MVKIIIFLFHYFVLFSLSFAGTYQEAVDAYKIGQYDIAAEIWLSLAEDGDPESQRELAFMYQQGKGIQQNYKKAVFWYTKAAEQGNQSAQFNLATMYRFGKGVAVDSNLMLKWYSAAAIGGHEWAQMELGGVYRLGEGVEKNPAKSYFWLGLAAKKGNSRAEKIKNLISKKMSAEQIEQINQKLEKCTVKNLIDCDIP